jgi:hypothetical protein
MNHRTLSRETKKRFKISVTNSQVEESSSTASQGVTSCKLSAQDEPECTSASSTSQSTTMNSRREEESGMLAVAEDIGVS